jgi:hypothetical protein
VNNDDNSTEPIRVPLTQGKFALVNPEDADLLHLKWYARKSSNGYYALRQSKGMHRVILERVLGRALKYGEYVDHIDRDTLNNQRGNLRLASMSQNLQNSKAPTRNTSGYKGVHWVKNNKKWRAQIRVNGHAIHLGLFDDPLDAHNAYCVAAKNYFGEFSRFE